MQLTELQQTAFDTIEYWVATRRNNVDPSTAIRYRKVDETILALLDHELMDLVDCEKASE